MRAIWAAVSWLLLLSLPAIAEPCREADRGTSGPVRLDVATFGAIPNDKADDSAALEAAIAAAEGGTTLVFAPGRYLISKTVALASGQSYFGQPGAKLAWSGPGAGFVLSTKDSEGVRIACLGFERGGVAFWGFNRDIEITGNSFADIYDPSAAFGQESAIFIAGLTDRLKIAHNRFRDIGMRAGKAGAGHGNAILAYHLNNAEIARNSFENVHQAISLIFEGKPGSGLGVAVRGNRVQNAHRMGIEAIGKGTHGAVFEGNVVAKGLGAGAKENIGMSITINQGVGTEVRDNRIESWTPSKGRCSGMGIEAAGIGTRVIGNRVAGNWCSAIAVHADQAQYSQVEDNLICGHQGPYAAIDFYHGRGRSKTRRNRIEGCCSDVPELIRKNAENQSFRATSQGH